MTELIPESFRELLSAACFAIGAVFSFFSLSADKREHALRLSGLFLLSSVALFANNGWCYFAAVFIIATAVTRLQFLQNLAAIIRGSKEFFDYQGKARGQPLKRDKIKTVDNYYGEALKN